MVATHKLIQTDVQEVVYRGAGFMLCRFHCPRHHRRWSEVNTIQDGHNVVFPRTFVTIEQAGKPVVRADANKAVFYNNGTDFRRRPTSRFDDRSDVILSNSAALIEAMHPYDSGVVDRPHEPFDRCAGTVDSAWPSGKIKVASGTPSKRTRSSSDSKTDWKLIPCAN